MVDSVARQPEPDRSYSTRRDESVLSSEPQFFVGVDPAATVEEMENAIWQNIGGHEIISLVRRDLVDGINLDYSLVSNLAKLFQEYNPKTIFSIEDVSATIFARFGIKLEKYVPSLRALALIDENLKSPVVLDDAGKIVIYLSNVEDDKEIEVQTINSEDILRDTIYENTLNGDVS
jgi:hypothetical protein